MATVKVEINPKGIAQLLRSPGVAADLERRARAVMERANTDEKANPAPLNYEVRTDVGKRRARAAVIAAGDRTMAHEAAHHTLVRAIDAARH